ncbi:alpha/beta fold hydrolase [Salipaludibacillus aurantiacus]|uniref:Pimeloyl-ACP methyl ester carboxylesterase n=1 Tax=Salipaludibacillus aurantiacus TaxID=1601833 RepID=A0A1H9VJS5_9BACI|nr:alpha/beta hydrolase [Salipaludibacillus aurantiacus]SES21771.1 Pimeloyl-ACP methyl ester carboxylesterase [Salipaludibacillus aurantiacus]
MPYFQSDGVSLYYESTGEGPPIIFICPPAMGGATFFEQQKQLKNHFQVITFDPRGNGKSSDGKTGDYTIYDWTEDVLALADHLKLEKVITCGYSMGGLPAQEFAISYPERTAGLILISSFSEVSTFSLSSKIKAGEMVGHSDLLELLAAGLSVSHTGLGSKKHKKKIFKSVNSSNSLLTKKLYRNGRHYRSTERLSSIQCPVALIYGNLDFLILPYQRLFEKRLAHPLSIKIKGVAHQVPTQSAYEVNSVIRSLKNTMAH